MSVNKQYFGAFGGVAYPGNGLDLKWLAAGLTIMFSKDNTVTHRTKKNKKYVKNCYTNGNAVIIVQWL